ncbi:hypothetical protein BAY59_10815 [Prauserella coralliicola]|nr:hypothetical protein BAY59_10815 [Prauserella coralliicola]
MANVIPAQSAGLEGAGTGNWAAWFGCTLAKSTVQAHAGTGSLEVTATGGSIGVTLNNWPGWTIVGGQDFQISAAAWKADPARAVTLTFRWRTSGGSDVQVDELMLNMGGSAWITNSAVVSVPATAVRLFVEITWSGAAGDVVYFDSFVADDEPVTSGPPEVTTSIPFAFALGAVAAADHEATAIIPLGVLLGADAAAEHRATAVIPLSLGLAASAEAVHEVTASIPLSFGIGAVTSAPGGALVAIRADIDDGPFKRDTAVPDGPALARTVTGPFVRRLVEGPAARVIELDGPATRPAAEPDGPALARTVDGPRVSRTFTGPGV